METWTEIWNEYLKNSGCIDEDFDTVEFRAYEFKFWLEKHYNAPTKKDSIGSVSNWYGTQEGIKATFITLARKYVGEKNSEETRSQLAEALYQILVREFPTVIEDRTTPEEMDEGCVRYNINGNDYTLIPVPIGNDNYDLDIKTE